MSSEYILLVDSNVGLAEKLKISLEKEGLTISIANSYTSAIELLDQSLPSLIISELLLNDINGLDFLDQVKQSDELKSVPFMFLTAANDLVLENRAWRQGVDEFHSKQLIKKQDLLRSIYKLTETNSRQSSQTVDQGHALSGSLSAIKLAVIVSFLNDNKLSGILHLHYGNRHAELSMSEGEIFYSILEDFQGVDVIEEIMKLRNGVFRFEMKDMELDKQNMDQSTQTIIKLLEN
ncbi:MAG: response regulator [Calditrichaeota bacterium]|nr:response regulator [Calditrichota bacterium]